MPGLTSNMAAITTVPAGINADVVLAERHRYGDAEAFDEVYQRFAELVFNLALRMSGRRDVAEDLAQEIFIRIFRHLGRFSGRSSLKTWVYRVAVNHCRSRLGRRRWLTKPLAEDDAEHGVQLVDERRTPESRTLAGDTERLVARALVQLKPAFREAVVLRDLEGLRYEEIAEVLNIRIGTVRSRIARGRERLRQVVVREALTLRSPEART